MWKSPNIVSMVFVAMAVGCGGDLDPQQPGFEDFNGVRMDLPEGPRAAFRDRFPGATMRTWNKVISDRGLVAYYVVFEKPDGSVEDVWISPKGEPVSPMIGRSELGEGER